MRAENAQLHVMTTQGMRRVPPAGLEAMTEDRRTHRTELFLRQQQRIIQHRLSLMSTELLEGPEFWLADMRIKDLPQICIDLAIEVFADYYNADLRMIFADALEDAGDPLCDSQRHVANIIRTVIDQRQELDSRLCIGGSANGKIAPRDRWEVELIQVSEPVIRQAEVPPPIRLQTERYTPFRCTLAGSEFTVKAIRELGEIQAVEMARKVIRERFGFNRQPVDSLPVTGPFCE